MTAITNLVWSVDAILKAVPLCLHSFLVIFYTQLDISWVIWVMLASHWLTGILWHFPPVFLTVVV